MADRLVHAREDVVDRWGQTEELMIGRVGPIHLHHTAWPTGSHDRPQRFVSGVLHETVAKTLDPQPATPVSLPSLSALRGFYSIAEHFPGGRFTLAVDRRGSFPIYYSQIEGYLIFAPEILALRAHPRLNKSLDSGAVASLLASGFLMGDQTLLSTVRRLRGGRVLKVKDHRCQQQTYWRFKSGTKLGVRAIMNWNLSSPDWYGRPRAVTSEIPTRQSFFSAAADSRGILGAALGTVRKQQAQ